MSLCCWILSSYYINLSCSNVCCKDYYNLPDWKPVLGTADKTLYIYRSHDPQVFRIFILNNLKIFMVFLTYQIRLWPDFIICNYWLHGEIYIHWFELIIISIIIFLDPKGCYLKYLKNLVLLDHVSVTIFKIKFWLIQLNFEILY